MLNWFEPVYCVGMPAEGAGGGQESPLWIDGLLNWFEPVYCEGMPAEGAGGGQERLLAPRSGGGQQG